MQFNNKVGMVISNKIRVLNIQRNSNIENLSDELANIQNVNTWCRKRTFFCSVVQRSKAFVILIIWISTFVKQILHSD